jgi:TM2 domain-containing membrane protein YozV
MDILAKIISPFLRAIGFLGLIVGLFFFLTMTGASGIRDSWPWGLAVAASLAAIWGGDFLKKRAERPAVGSPAQAGGTPISGKGLLQVLAAILLSLLFPGAGQAYNGQLGRGVGFGLFYLVLPVAVLYLETRGLDWPLVSTGLVLFVLTLGSIADAGGRAYEIQTGKRPAPADGWKAGVAVLLLGWAANAGLKVLVVRPMASALSDVHFSKLSELRKRLNETRAEIDRNSRAIDRSIPADEAKAKAEMAVQPAKKGDGLDDFDAAPVEIAPVKKSGPKAGKSL